LLGSSGFWVRSGRLRNVSKLVVHIGKSKKPEYSSGLILNNLPGVFSRGFADDGFKVLDEVGLIEITEFER